MQNRAESSRYWRRSDIRLWFTKLWFARYVVARLGATVRKRKLGGGVGRVELLPLGGGHLTEAPFLQFIECGSTHQSPSAVWPF
jgi:hypothetical protein